jgi:hypothetical protein
MLQGWRKGSTDLEVELHARLLHEGEEVDELRCLLANRAFKAPSRLNEQGKHTRSLSDQPAPVLFSLSDILSGWLRGGRCKKVLRCLVLG